MQRFVLWGNREKVAEHIFPKLEAGEQRFDIVEIKKFATLYRKEIGYFVK